MPKRKKKPDALKSPAPVTVPKHWLRADYHFHVFHYRMPETVAIASVTPFVPSPLTVKMALIASLLQNGDDESAKKLAPLLPQIEVSIVPPPSAFSFKAFLRYRSVPAVESAGGLDETGSYYPSRPHTREYALLEEGITLFLGLPDSSLLEVVKTALKNIRYLGCKDSLVTCLGVEEIGEDEIEKASTVQPLQEGVSGGSVILGADFESSAPLDLKNLIPGSRKEEHYRRLPFILPGKITVKGKSRIFRRD